MIVDAELHDGGSAIFTLVFLLVTSKACSRSVGLFRCRIVRRANVRMDRRPGGWLTHAFSIFTGGYEFESGKPAIS
jgi:hypothetical protein